MDRGATDRAAPASRPAPGSGGLTLFARWFGIVSAVLAVLSAAGALGLAYTAGLFQAFGLVLALDSLWILGVSVSLWRKPERALA